MTQFARLRETNENEGETWNFWLQVDGNEAEVSKLAALLDDLFDEEDSYDEDPYDLTGDIESEQVVDVLVLYAEDGYMSSHQKITGRFTCPDDLGECGDKLYKGGIKSMFHAPTGTETKD